MASSIWHMVGMGRQGLDGEPLQKHICGGVGEISMGNDMYDYKHLKRFLGDRGWARFSFDDKLVGQQYASHYSFRVLCNSFAMGLAPQMPISAA